MNGRTSRQVGPVHVIAVSRALVGRSNPWCLWECGNGSVLATEVQEIADCELCLAVVEARRLGHPDRFGKVQSVYFAERDGLVKIGISKNPGRRIRSLRADLLAIEPAPDGFGSERAVHERFAHLRVEGEWFEPGADLVAHIDSLLRNVA